MSRHASWNALPSEMRLAIVDLLEHDALAALSLASRANHTLCLPALFHTVSAPSFAALQAFLHHVPPAYGAYIHHLDICTRFLSPSPVVVPPSSPGTPRSDAVVRLLERAPRLERLHLRLAGGLAPHALAAFPALTRLSDLSIENCDEEDSAPLSERTVVAIALSLPSLRRLSLTRITRSLCPGVPAAFPSIPTDPANLILPSLLTIPSLRHLAIKDTHLGDPRFASELPTAPLESLELGAYDCLSPTENAANAARILSRVGPSLCRLVLSSALPASTAPFVFPALTSVRLTPLVSPSNIPDTLRSLRAPMKIIHLQTLPDDLEDVCEALEECEAGQWALHLGVLRALEGDVLAGDDKEDVVLDENARDAIRRLEGAGWLVGVEGAVSDEIDWDERTVVDDSSPVPSKRTSTGPEVWDIVIPS
ncbi:hypothetical protein FA95DRAFT_1552686 [Auriscalpium vulgare]|uniref:Uncharacterized protein n=1 Tax=Auriscalpium vulgare TaxID=40419 RepID=A0ACB8SAJ5_9AGAM|nr:hypothetical protein FA95DRAFT_1552686 [Auriscalpium vulgare]